MFDRHSRRALLRSLGVGAGAWFLPSLLGSDRAARAAAPPKRLVVVWSHHGTVYDAWKMRQGGTDGADWSFSLNDANVSWSNILQPLAPFRDKLLVVDGLSMPVCWADPGPGNEHSKGQSNSLTGAFCAGDAVGGGPSIDQIVAGVNNRPGGLKSLELAVGGSLPATFSGRAQRIPATESPMDAFKRVFPAGVPSGAATPAPLPSAPAPALTDADRIRRAQAKVLALAKAQHDALAPKLSKDDRTKIDLHRSLLSDLMKRFDTTSTGTGGGSDPGGGVSMAGCQASTPKDASEYKALADEMIKVVVGALSCDQTRVVSLQLAQVPNTLVGVPDGQDLHNEYIHDVQNMRHPNSIQVLTEQNLIYSNVVAKLVGALKAIPEGGGTLLDNTVVLWAYELATGDHSFQRIPVVLAGNAGGYFATGKYLHFAAKLPSFAQYDPSPAGPAHNHYLVDVANAFGVATDHVGESSVQARNGQTVSLTGGLPGLKA